MNSKLQFVLEEWGHQEILEHLVKNNKINVVDIEIAGTEIFDEAVNDGLIDFEDDGDEESYLQRIYDRNNGVF